MPSEENRLERKDVLFASAAGFFIGLLLLPILRASKPDLYEKVFLLTIPFFLIATPLGLIIAYHISKKFAFVWQLGKFGVTGVLNALVDLGILSLLTFIFSSYFQIEASTEIFAGIAFLTFYSFYKSVSFIIAESALILCGILLSSDAHLRNADFAKLSVLLQSFNQCRGGAHPRNTRAPSADGQRPPESDSKIRFRSVGGTSGRSPHARQAALASGGNVIAGGIRSRRMWFGAALLQVCRIRNKRTPQICGFFS